MKTEMKKSNKKRTIFIICMLAIPITHFLIFYVFVNLQNFVMGFQRYDRFGNLYYTLENFNMLFRDLGEGGIGYEAIMNTLGYFIMGVVVTCTLCVMLAYFSYKNLWGDTFRRIADAGVNLMSSVAIAISAKAFFNPGGPISNIVTSMTGAEMPMQLFQDSVWANPSLFIYVFWMSLGINLYIRGAMMRIPEDILEYGQLDGLTWLQEIRHIILPMIWPTMVTLLTLQSTSLLTASGPVYLFTQGDNGTNTISYWLFTQQLGASAKSNSLHYASAISMMMMVITVPFVFGTRYFLNKVHDIVDY